MQQKKNLQQVLESFNFICENLDYIPLCYKFANRLFLQAMNWILQLSLEEN